MWGGNHQFPTAQGDIFKYLVLFEQTVQNPNMFSFQV